MTRVALRTLFGTAFPEAAGIGRIFWDIGLLISIILQLFCRNFR